jgi:exodeoxyribonuclease V alpha subunit
VTKNAYEIDAFVAAELKDRATAPRWHPGVLKIDPADPDLCAEQLAAVEAIGQCALCVVTGPPGSGKSHLVRAIVRALGADRCLLTAPTGRCARSLEGRTVHSHTARAGGRTETAHRRPLQETSKADIRDDLLLLACDEASMLTGELMASLLRLAPRGAHVLLVGDVDQLPPVGPGNVLADIVRTGACTVVRLGQNHRFGAGISAAAADVLAGRPPTACETVVVSQPRDLVAETVKLALRGAQPLVPTNAARTTLNRAIQVAKSPCGVDVVLTRSIGAADAAAGDRGTLRIDSEGRATLTTARGKVSAGISTMLGSTRVSPAGRLASEPGVFLAPGDPVVILKNQAGKTGRLACNGDVGVLETFSSTHAMVDIDGHVHKISFPPGRADRHLTLAHALTVHKAQGGEFPSVVLPVAEGWNRGLLYTAISRAKDIVHVMGSPRDVIAAAARAPIDRDTLLRVLL